MTTLCFLLFTILLATEDPAPRFAPPKDVDGRGRAEFLASVREDRYDSLRQRWLIAGDPMHALPDDVRKNLDDAGVGVRVNNVVQKDSSVKRLGLSVEEKLFAKYESRWKDIRKNLEKRLVGMSVLESCKVLADASTELESFKIDDLVSRVSVEFQLDTVVSKSPEVWLLINVFSSEPAYSAYATSVYNRVKLSSGRRMVRISPHPFEDLRVKEVERYFAKPLEGNRPPVNDGSPPLKELLDDGLQSSDREFLLGFSIIDDVRSQSYQIESVQFDLDSKLTHSYAKQTILKRIPPGKVLSYDELNAICAEFCSEYRTKQNRKEQFLFLISPHPHGKWTYADLHIRVIDLEKTNNLRSH